MTKIFNCFALTMSVLFFSMTLSGCGGSSNDTIEPAPVEQTTTDPGEEPDFPDEE
ncbi:MAG: hypothetical protein QGG09_05550 [Pirellulaceae bacterium]|jgi:hypothetical protein|nr:hypothetical protein [Pirellulaceae bacterium]HJN13203.1 hypothetical protein [Pirellulaceae bacterium]